MYKLVIPTIHTSLLLNRKKRVRLFLTRNSEDRPIHRGAVSFFMAVGGCTAKSQHGGGWLLNKGFGFRGGRPLGIPGQLWLIGLAALVSRLINTCLLATKYPKNVTTSARLIIFA
jgi:hypothetical protein